MVELKATYVNVPTGSSENSTTTGTYKYNYSSNFVNFNDFKSQRVVPKYATLEPRRNKLDGTFINVPSNPSGYGYLSSIQCDENGAFANDIVITRTYANTYAAPGINIEFDSWTNDYPSTVNVQWLLNDVVQESGTYTIDSANYFCEKVVAAYNKVILTFEAGVSLMNNGTRFLKIYNITDGISREFYNDEIQNCEIIEEIETNNVHLASNQSGLGLIPTTTRGIMFQRTLPFNLYRNDVLYGRFFVNSTTSNTYKTNYNLKLNDYIMMLDAQTYLGGQQTYIYDFLSDILGDIPYTVSGGMNGWAFGYLPIMTKREALRQVCFAMNALVDTSRSDEIVIKPMPTTISRTIQPSEIISIDTTQDNITTAYEIIKNRMRSGETEELFSDTLNGTTSIIFDSPKRFLQITNGTIVDSGLNYAIISGTGGTVTLTGLNVEIYTTTDTITNPYTVSTDAPKVETFDLTLWKSNLPDLKFVKYKIKARFLMGNTKVGDLVSIDGNTARVMSLSYDLAQTNIYCDAELEVYYE